jgi:hypothetical protein
MSCALNMEATVLKGIVRGKPWINGQAGKAFGVQPVPGPKTPMNWTSFWNGIGISGSRRAGEMKYDLVTHNTQDFANVPRLRLLDWTIP